MSLKFALFRFQLCQAKSQPSPEEAIKPALFLWLMKTQVRDTIFVVSNCNQAFRRRWPFSHAMSNF